MSQEKGLPRGWTALPLSHVIAENKNGFGKRRQDRGSPTVVLRLADIKEGEICLEDVRRINATPRDLDEYSLQPDDLLAIRVNGSPNLVGRLVRFQGAAEAVLFCDHFIRMRLRDTGLAKFLRFYGDTPEVRHFIDQNKVCSAGQNTISQGSLGAMEVPIPPQDEQRRIVAKIEELFSDLDAGVAALERVRANLKRYRASVLKAAVEGRLTEKWRNANPSVEPASKLLQRILAERRKKWEEQRLAKFAEAGKSPPKNWRDKYEEPAAPDTSNLLELPKGWTWATVEQLIVRSEYGTSVKCDYGAKHAPVLRIPNIAGGVLDLSDMKCAMTPLELDSKSALRSGDLLVCRTNGSISLIGKSALVRAELKPFHAFASYLLRFRFADSGVLPRWVHLYLSSSHGRSFIEANAASSAGQHNISLSLLHRMLLPLPPLPEQNAMVSLVEEKLSGAESVQGTIATGLTHAARLRQSILKRAFEGKLVPQDPKDEPASVLLERIGQEHKPRVAGKPTARIAKRGARR